MASYRTLLTRSGVPIMNIISKTKFNLYSLTSISILKSVPRYKLALPLSQFCLSTITNNFNDLCIE